MLGATGTIHGTRTVAFCSDATVMGGAMGVDGCEAIVQAYRRGHGRPACRSSGIWHSGGARLAEGVLSLHAVGPDLPRDDPGLRQDPADLDRARARPRAARPTGRR